MFLWFKSCVFGGLILELLFLQNWYFIFIVWFLNGYLFIKLVLHFCILYLIWIYFLLIIHIKLRQKPRKITIFNFQHRRFIPAQNIVPNGHIIMYLVVLRWFGFNFLDFITFNNVSEIDWVHKLFDWIWFFWATKVLVCVSLLTALKLLPVKWCCWFSIRTNRFCAQPLPRHPFLIISYPKQLCLRRYPMINVLP